MMSENTGSLSVCHLLQSRPQVAKFLDGHGALKRWLIAQFLGEATNFPIFWDPDEPVDSDVAEHSLPCEDEPAKIRVSKSMSGRDQVCAVVFELFNIRTFKKQSQLWEQACKGKIGKHEYSLRAYHLEYKAMKKCRGFLKKHASVFAPADNSDEVYNTIMSLPSFKEFFARQIETQEGRTYFERMFEERIVRIRQTGQAIWPDGTIRQEGSSGEKGKGS